jgi:rRNA maturation RNase YbeY
LVKNLQVCSIDPSIKKREVHKLVASLKKHLNFNISALYINFISSGELLEINRKYLKHNYRTDVVTFNYSYEKSIDGEILVSVDDAKANAVRFKVTYSSEITRLIIHGILHLLGYDDRRKKDRILMKEFEKELLNKNKFILFAGR